MRYLVSLDLALPQSKSEMSNGIVKEYLGLFAQPHGIDLRTFRPPGKAKAKIHLAPFKAIKYSTIVTTDSRDDLRFVVNVIDQTTDWLSNGCQNTPSGRTQRRYAGWFKCHIGLGRLYLGLLAARCRPPRLCNRLRPIVS
jgi:hypothetical protein